MRDKTANKTILIIGGGLSGLTASILLKRAGFGVTLIEKKTYPFHRVCGEYLSNEVLPFLHSLDIDFSKLNPSSITKLAISSPSGKLFKTDLDLGGFGLSRYTFDNYLYQQAIKEGVEFKLGCKVTKITFIADKFEIKLSDNTILNSDLTIASYGKQSNLDKNRKFLHKRSPYLGVKYHIHTDFPSDLIQLDNFEGGYCGTVKIEGDRYNLCYLSENHHLKKHGSIEAMEEHVLFKNPFLKERFLNADYLNVKREVINEISFEQKPLVENHVLYCGDAAGMISPLCGNGMAMAIHAAKILSETITEYYPNRQTLEHAYQARWKNAFDNRLRIGRLTQKLFGKNLISELSVECLKSLPKLSKYILKRTHGNPF
ncbi:NAD(P)/FAD-dependent oxidoreductase [Pedobacter sp. P351]|uniref:NAD(P)/FAD-dependent oxidoreductase n=1 Tax=Pedobacter superstes TaxID=3133441 RepID=UPI0030A85A44